MINNLTARPTDNTAVDDTLITHHHPLPHAVAGGSGGAPAERKGRYVVDTGAVLTRPRSPDGRMDDVHMQVAARMIRKLSSFLVNNNLQNGRRSFFKEHK